MQVSYVVERPGLVFEVEGHLLTVFLDERGENLRYCLLLFLPSAQAVGEFQEPGAGSVR